MTQQEIFQEYTKSYLDLPYFANKYCKVFDLTRGGTYDFELFPRQIELVDHFKKNPFSIVLKPRQAGVSTTTAFYCAHLIMFAPKSKQQKVLIIANKQDTAFEFLAKIVSFIDTAPRWLLERDKDDKVIYEKKNSGEILLPNGSGAKAKATSADAARGYTPTLLVMDEAAFIENGKAVWLAAAAALSTGGGAILLSTPNSFDELYYSLYKGAIDGKNEFKVFEMNWFEDPRFNKGMTWHKTTIIDDEIKEDIIECWDRNKFKELLSNGYIPTSPWFESMCKKYNNDQRMVAQELLGDFLGSGDNVVDMEYIKNQEKLCVKEPIEFAGFDKNIWIWEKPIKGHQYMLAGDVGLGSSDDYSTFSIWDIETGNEVVEYMGHIPPDVLGVLIDEWGRKYEAYVIIDVTGGMGQSTVIKLMDLKYPYMHYSEGAGIAVIKQSFLKFKKQNNQVPGFVIGPNRTNMISTLEIAIRCNQIAIRSSRFINELKTFIWKNGRPDHMNGHHDDLIFTGAMVWYVHQHAFKNLKKYKEQTIAMLNAYDVSSSTRMSIHNSPLDANLNDYSWLFK